MTYRSTLLISALLITAPLVAQKGISLEWNKTITAIPDSITNGTHRLGAFTVQVYEIDADDLMTMWSNDFKAISQKVETGKPAKALGAVFTAVNAGPILVLAQTATEKKAGLSKLTIAFAQTDSTPLVDCSACKQAATDLAVKYNKAVVQGQVSAQEAIVAKATGKLADANDDEAKQSGKVTQANTDLQKLKAKMGKIQKDNAKVQGDIAGLEARLQVRTTPKDQEKLAKARGKLASGESALAKLMQQEAKLQGNLNKYQDNLKGTAADQEERTGTKEEEQAKLDALKRKMDNIR